MKKIFLCLLATCLSFVLFPVLANAATDKTPSSLVGTTPKPVDSKETKTMLLRIDEINKMDKTNLKASEKKALRKEVKSINNRLKNGGYIYVSVGAVILIVILLVILL